MKLNQLKPYKKTRKRLGRGHSAGQGKTSGRGHKGQKARAGKKLRAGFEGGQTPIFQRLPKYRGFKNPNHIDYQTINISQLALLKEKVITKELLHEKGFIETKSTPIKILGMGDLTSALKISVEKASRSAINKITKAGGSFTSTLKTAEIESNREKADSNKTTNQKTTI